MKLLMENLPPSLASQRETLTRCLEAMNAALPFCEVWLFGSHARGDARPDSDVDLCIVADGAEQQSVAAQFFRRAMRPIMGKPSFSLVPIAPARLEANWLWFGTSDVANVGLRGCNVAAVRLARKRHSRHWHCRLFRAQRFGVRRVLAPLSIVYPATPAIFSRATRVQKRRGDAPHSIAGCARKSCARHLTRSAFARSPLRPRLAKNLTSR